MSKIKIEVEKLVEDLNLSEKQAKNLIIQIVYSVNGTKTFCEEVIKELEKEKPLLD